VILQFQIGFCEPYDEDEDTGVNGGDAVAHFYRTKLKNHFRQKKMTNGVNGPNRETDMPLVLPSSKRYKMMIGIVAVDVAVIVVFAAASTREY